MSGPKQFEILLTEGAQRDVEFIHDYIFDHDSHANANANANAVLDGLLNVAQSLSKHPLRGSYPKELLSLGIKEYRQIFFKPYRVIYRVMENRVVIYLIVDGQRDMQTVLAERLLSA